MTRRCADCQWREPDERAECGAGARFVERNGLGAAGASDRNPTTAGEAPPMTVRTPNTPEARAAFAKWWMDGRGIEPEFRTEFGFDKPGRTPRIAVRCTDCDHAQCTGWVMTIPDDEPNP